MGSGPVRGPHRAQALGAECGLLPQQTPGQDAELVCVRAAT